MRTTAPFLILLIALLLAVPQAALPTAQAQTGKTIHLTPDQNGETIMITAGDRLQVELPFDPGAAFTWRLILTRTVDQVDVTVIAVQPGSPADKAGLRPGDVIRSVNGEAVESGSALDELLQAQVGQEVTLGVDRGADHLEVTLGVRDLPRPILERPYVIEVAPDMPAARAGFAVGDVILAVDGVQVGSIDQLVDYIVAREGVEIVVTIRRGTEKQELPVTPRPDPADGVPRIGVGVAAAQNVTAGLSVGHLNVRWYYGVRPSRGQMPPGEQRIILQQRGDPAIVGTDDAGSLVVWTFDAVQPGETRLSFGYGNFDLDAVDIQDVFEVLVIVEPARQTGPAA